MDFALVSGPSGVASGLHRADDSSAVFEIQECHLQAPPSDEIRNWFVERLRSACTVPPSFFRRLTIRTSEGGARVLLVLETAAGALPEGPAIGREAMRRFGEVSGVLRRIVDPGGTELSVRKLAGEAMLRETIAGVTFTLSAGAFLQVNTKQAARLYATIESFASLRPEERLLDLYCGVGAITLLLGRGAARAVGVELSAEAVQCAEANARANGAASCRFLAGDARRIAAGMAGAGERFEAIVANPPRAGLPETLVDSVSRLGAERIVYVSCSPATLAIRHVLLPSTAPFDMFPHTYHIETAARLERTAPPRHPREA